jgi:hypothetical protein
LIGMFQQPYGPAFCDWSSVVLCGFADGNQL